MRRLHNLGGGKFSAAWTFSNQLTTSWSDRGTGYVYNSGGNWGAYPTARLESVRTGWPNVQYTATGKEITVAHDPQNNELVMEARPVAGTGSWKETILTNLKPMEIWPRMATGGSNGETIHLIALTSPTVFGGVPYKGMDGALLYSRSTDGGITWDNPKQLPGMDVASFPDGIGGDAYSIDSKGDIVSIVVSETGQSIYMWKSVDNGVTWTKKNIFDNGVGVFKTDDPKISPNDTIPTGDGGSTVIIDNNDMIHVVFGRIRILDDNKTDGAYSVFLNWYAALGYWNENMPTGESGNVGGWLNTDGTAGYNITSFNAPRYGNNANIVSHPHLGIDANNGLYLIFTSLTEYNDGSDYYRHTYGCYSKDGGCTWSMPVDLTPGTIHGGLHDFDECVFGSIAKTVDNNIYFIYQNDFTPGNSLANDPPSPLGDNNIIFVTVPVTDLDTTPLWCNTTFIGDSIFCSGDSVYLEASCGSAYKWSTGATTPGVWLSSYGTYTVDITTACGVDTRTVTTKAPSTAPKLTVSASSLEACDGDTVTLTASSVAGVSYLWSNGDTTAIAKVDSAKTYYVTVTNCGGTKSDSITIKLPKKPVATLTGTLTACLNDSTLISAVAAPSATYVWSTGDSTQSIYAQNGQTYSVIVSNCGGTDTTAVTIDTTALPTAKITATSGTTTFCEGGSVTLAATGGDSYKWSSGTTNPFLTVTQSGSYVVTSFNVCGDSAVSSATVVKVNPLPASPTITYVVDTMTGNVIFTSNETTGNRWYANGSIISGQLGQTYTTTWQSVVGKSISAAVIDGNGCISPKSTAVIAIPTGINESANHFFKLFPNPNNGIFTLNINPAQGSYNLTIRNIVGQVVYGQSVLPNSNKLDFNFSNLEKGIYFLTLSNKGFEKTEKVVLK